MATGDSVSDKLRALRERSGLSVRAVADAVDRPLSTYSSYERAAYKKEYLPMSMAGSLAQALVGLGSPPISREEVMALFVPPGALPDNGIILTADLHRQIDQPGDRAVPFTPIGNAPPKAGMPRDVPVLGTAAGANGDGAFLLNQGSPVDWTRRAPGIAQNRGVFAIYVDGDSMAPRFESGDLIYVDEARPARVGDDVVIVVACEQEGEPPRSYLKRLVRRTAEKVIVEQYNPPKELSFPTRAIRKTYRVLRMNELMGI